MLMFHLQRFITWVLIVLTFSHGFPEKFLTTPWKEDADGSGSAAAAVAERLLAQAIAQTDDLETQCVCGCPDKVLMRQNPTYKSYKYCQRGPKETQDSAPEWNLAFHSSCVLHQCVLGLRSKQSPAFRLQPCVKICAAQSWCLCCPITNNDVITGETK